MKHSKIYFIIFLSTIIPPLKAAENKPLMHACKNNDTTKLQELLGNGHTWDQELDTKAINERNLYKKNVNADNYLQALDQEQYYFGNPENVLNRCADDSPLHWAIVHKKYNLARLLTLYGKLPSFNPCNDLLLSKSPLRLVALQRIITKQETLDFEKFLLAHEVTTPQPFLKTNDEINLSKDRIKTFLLCCNRYKNTFLEIPRDIIFHILSFMPEEVFSVSMLATVVKYCSMLPESYVKSLHKTALLDAFKKLDNLELKKKYKQSCKNILIEHGMQHPSIHYVQKSYNAETLEEFLDKQLEALFYLF
ncbi:MAG: hypothetical protein AB7R69_01375 [Candidatus Babeliales bacterium]